MLYWPTACGDFQVARVNRLQVGHQRQPCTALHRHSLGETPGMWQAKHTHTQVGGLEQGMSYAVVVKAL